ncbi:MAG: hypothetical protein M3P06_21890 [Acidobacteriota bacterium]|nr:hypothetical protein [Acidobacteriota bacterium]
MTAPPAAYWDALASEATGTQVARLRELFENRITEFNADDLPPRETAVALLERLVTDGWLTRTLRRRCPHCNEQLDDATAAGEVCPECNEALSQHGGITTETIYIRDIAPSRVVDWVIAIHGMNTTGAWQESFSWLLSTTWGRSVPVAVYKYGIVLAGVVMAWRRNKLREQLREKLAALRDQARAQGFTGNPDLIAHSFGTWLFGHLLERELARPPKDRLKFGRVILTGCVLRPDFDWKRIKDAGLVEDILNHYGTADRVVPCAHPTIHNSGPSGQRGFDGHEVINIRAEGYGHSDLFLRDLGHSYKVYWKPFLTLPRKEFDAIPDRIDPDTVWRPLPWPLRGTLFPFIALPLIAAFFALIDACIGRGLWEVRGVLAMIAVVGAGGIVALAAGIGITKLVRRIFGVR